LLYRGAVRLHRVADGLALCGRRRDDLFFGSPAVLLLAVGALRLGCIAIYPRVRIHALGGLGAFRRLAGTHHGLPERPGTFVFAKPIRVGGVIYLRRSGLISFFLYDCLFVVLIVLK